MSEVLVRILETAELRDSEDCPGADVELQRLRYRAFALLSSLGLCNDAVVAAWRAAERQMGWPSTHVEESCGSYRIRVGLAPLEAVHVRVTAARRELGVYARAMSTSRPAGAPAVRSHLPPPAREVFRVVPLPIDACTDGIEATIAGDTLEIVVSRVRHGTTSQGLTAVA